MLRTVDILKRFWGRSALEMAPIDMQTDSLSKGAAAKGAFLSPLQRSALLVTHPAVSVGVLVAFGVVAVGSSVMVYDDFFYAYKDGCTKTVMGVDADGRPEEKWAAGGTYLVKNAYSVAFNYASHEGTS